MKKLLLGVGTLLIGLTIAIGCTNEEALKQSNLTIVKASIDSHAARTTVTDEYKVVWSEYDAFTVFGNSTKGDLTLNGTGETSTGEFKGTLTEALVNGDVAIFPAVTGNSMTYTFKENYTDTETDAPLYGTYSGTAFLFEHLAAFIRVSATDLPAGAAVLTITSETQALTGEATLDSEKVLIPTSGGKTITVTFTAAEGADLKFDAPIPAQNYDKITLELKVGETQIIKKERTLNAEVGKLYELATTYTSANNVLSAKAALQNVNQENKNAHVVVSEVSGDGDNNFSVPYVEGSIVSIDFTDVEDGSTLSIESNTDATVRDSRQQFAINVGNESTEGAELTINTPTATVEVGKGYFTTVTATTASNTLMVKKDVTIKKLNLNGGHVIIEAGATVGQIANADGFMGKTYVVNKNDDSPKIDAGATNIVLVKSESEMALRIAAENGGKVILEEDIILVEELTIASGKTVTLDLNGNTISQEKECTASYGMITNKGTLTIDDSSEDKSGKISFKDTGAGDSSFGWGAYTLINSGTLIVENGIIENLSQQNTPGNVVHMYCAIQSTGTTTIKAGKISTPTYRSVRPNKGSLIIEGGTFEGQVWLQPNHGNVTLEISGGTFAPAGGDGSSIFMTNTGENYTVSSVSVTGGMFTTKIGCTTPDKEGVKGCITGGVFTESAKNGTNVTLLAEDYSFVLSEGNYVVSKTKQ